MMKFNGHELQRWRNGGVLCSQMNNDIISCYTFYKRVFGKPVHTYIERTKRGKERAKLFMMKRYPRFFTKHALRSRGLTLRGQRRIYR